MARLPARSAPVTGVVNVPGTLVFVIPCAGAFARPEVASSTAAVTQAPSW